MRPAGGVQRVLLVPTDDAVADLGGLRRPVVLVGPDPGARARADALGLPVVVRPELAAEPGPATAERTHRLEGLVRGQAVQDRWRDVVVVADASTVRAVGAALCGLAGPPAEWGERDVVTVGLPRRPRPVPLRPVLVAAAVVALVSLLAQAVVHPLLLPAVAAAVGLVLLPWRGVRRWGLALLGVGLLSAAAVLVAVAGSTRFPAQ